MRTLSTVLIKSGSFTGSLSASRVIVSQLTASSFSIDSLSVNHITSSAISSSYIITSEAVIQSGTGSFNYLSINNTGSAPTNTTDPGSPGEIRFDNNFIYIHTNEKWIRTPISQWN